MPPSSRRTRGRKETEALQQQSDMEAPDAVHTPSRKRRKVNAEAAGSRAITRANATSASQRAASVASDATVENEGDGEPDINEVIRRLQVAKEPVNAQIDWDNQLHRGEIDAFVKIAGRNWTFYARKTSILIGRVPQERKRQQQGQPQYDEQGNPVSRPVSRSMEFSTPSRQTPTPFAVIDIDLGPDHQISRLHAAIEYNAETGRWRIIVNGRNGIKVDDEFVDGNSDGNSSQWLHSGSVMLIGGTEMIFVLPNEPPHFTKSIRARIADDGQSDEADEDEADADETDNDLQPKEEGIPSSSRRANGSARVTTRTDKPMSAPSRQVPNTPAPIKKSPALGKALLLEGTQEIDYSLDSSKDIKPPFSYAYMIGMAILEAPEQNLTLAQIYDYIRNNYAYFRHNDSGWQVSDTTTPSGNSRPTKDKSWQNSIRHNLSLNKAFAKIPRRTDEPGKGMKWRIADQHRDDFIEKTIRNARRGVHRHGSSGPNSPALGEEPSPMIATQRLQNVLGDPPAFSRPGGPAIKTSPRSPSPLLPSFPTANESYTPDRGPRQRFKQSPILSTLKTSHLPKANGETKTPTFATGAPELTVEGADSSANRSSALKSGLIAAAQQSPPTLSSSMMDNHFVTPLMPRFAPRPVVPTTAHAPSYYMQSVLSSPAPFWHYNKDIGSTPYKMHSDFSPLKGMQPLKTEDDTKQEPKEEDEDEDDGAPVVQPSSPPQMMDAGGDYDMDMSPTRTISRPMSRRDAKAPVPKLELTQKPIFGLGVQGANISPTNNAPPANGMGSLPAPRTSFASVQMGNADSEEEGGIDLAKGFQKIGAYHRNIVTG